VTVGLLDGIRWLVIADCSIVPSVVGVAVAIPQKTNSVINDDVRVWPTHEISDGVSANDS
jgi:hypothetical protein